MKQKILNWFVENHELVADVMTFIGVVIVGIIIKIYKEMRKGVIKFSWKWLFAEAIISFFVAFTVLKIFDQFLHMDKMFTYVICAWAGSLSNTFHAKTEELLSKLFDGIADYIKPKKN